MKDLVFTHTQAWGIPGGLSGWEFGRGVHLSDGSTYSWGRQVILGDMLCEGPVEDGHGPTKLASNDGYRVLWNLQWVQGGTGYGDRLSWNQADSTDEINEGGITI